MSFNLGSNVSVSSETYTVASGTIAFQMNMPYASNATYTMDVVDVGKFEVDFDVQPDFDVNQRFRFNVPELEFTIRDILSGGQSFIGLTANLAFNDIIAIKVTFNGSSDYYYAQKMDCEFDFNERKTKIKALYPVAFFSKLEANPTYSSDLLPPDKSFVINTVFSGKLVDFNDDPLDSTPAAGDLEKTTFVNDFISGILGLIGDNTSSYISSIFYHQTYDDFFTGSEADGDRAMLMDVAAGRNLSQGQIGEIGYDQAVRYVLDFARADGAYFGNILGNVFYASRALKDNRSNYSIELTSDNILELELIRNTEQVGEFSLEIGLFDNNDDKYDINLIEVINDSIRDDEGNTTGTKIDFNTIGGIDLDLFPSYSEYVLPGDFFNIDGTSLEIQIDDFAQANNHPYTSQTISREDMVFESYKKALKYDTEFMIKGKVAGITTLLPHQWIDMGSGIHPLVDGKDFRLSKISYDVTEDVVEFEAYEF